MSLECGICLEVKDQVLSLPCNDQHQACKRCLQKQRILIGDSIKCHECRVVFGVVDLDLLRINGGCVPDKQKCMPCLQSNRTAGSAVQFCVNCLKRLCEECFVLHQRLHCGEDSHDVIPFEEYRKCSDKLSDRTCPKDGHTTKIRSVCTKCLALGCVDCWMDADNCQTDNEKHNFESLGKRVKETVTNLQHGRDATRAEFDNNEQILKLLLGDMEIYRKEVAHSRLHLKERLERKVAQLQMEYRRIDRLLEIALEQKKEQVEQSREYHLRKAEELQAMQDGITGLLSSCHPARLITSEAEVLDILQGVRVDQNSVNFEPPEVTDVETGEYCLLGLSLEEDVEEDCSGEDETKMPYQMVYVASENIPKGQSCMTICYLVDEGPLLHIGQHYNKFPGITKAQQPICMRSNRAGFVEVLLTDLEANETELVTYHSSQQENVWSFAELERTKIGNYNLSDHSHFLKVQTTIYHIGNDNSIQMVNIFSGQRCGSLSHPEMINPYGICIHQDDIFISCKAMVFTFNHYDPKSTIRKFAEGYGELKGIAHHCQYLYLIQKDPQRILVLNLSGRKVKEFNLKNYTKASIYDISINSKGCVAVAAGKRGALKFEITYFED